MMTVILSIRMLSVIVGIHCAVAGKHTVTKTSTRNYLWDLNADPYETKNLYHDDDYQEIVTSLLSLLDASFDDVSSSRECDKADVRNTIGEEAAFRDCGGVCSYVDNNEVIAIEQIYFPESPPNIVFMLVDDWGYNDVGYQSTFLNWTTPTIDKLVTEGVTMSNYFTHFYCIPSRGALMTGRSSNRLGLSAYSPGEPACELPLDEVTLAQEMKSAGYKTYMVGKWHLGLSSAARTPTYRGFDEFYGYYSGFIDYYTKSNQLDFVDLQSGSSLVTDAAELDSGMHASYLLQEKAEMFIAAHASMSVEQPMFLYYALQLVHSPYEAPEIYSSRCTTTEDNSKYSSYCALNLMVDEVVANITCALSSNGMIDNTIVILASDNGGSSLVPGSSLPFRGHKYDFTRGGVTANAYIFSKLLSDSVRGTSYGGLMHVSDWLPTLMYVATEGAWTGSYSGVTLDGVNQWEAIMNNQDSPRSVIIHYVNYNDTSIASMQWENYKLDIGIELPDFDSPQAIVSDAMDGSGSYYSCENPTYENLAEQYLTVYDQLYLLPRSVSLMLSQDNTFVGGKWWYFGWIGAALTIGTGSYIWRKKNDSYQIRFEYKQIEDEEMVWN